MLGHPLGGTIVTVSSVLGDVGAAHLSDYAAAKAGLVAMHTSLQQEVASMVSSMDTHPGAKNVRMVLVKPGQLSTQMFQSLTTPNSFFGPVVQGLDLAKAVVEAIDGGRNAVVALPLYAGYIEWLSVLPYGIQRIARWMSGVDRAMDTFSVDGQTPS